ncbi:hypothetical protein D3C86_788310 [compost metagenome]
MVKQTVNRLLFKFTLQVQIFYGLLICQEVWILFFILFFIFDQFNNPFVIDDNHPMTVVGNPFCKRIGVHRLSVFHSCRQVAENHVFAFLLQYLTCFHDVGRDHEQRMWFTCKGFHNSNGTFVSVFHIGTTEQFIKYHKQVFTCTKFYGYFFHPKDFGIEMTGAHGQIIW